MTRPANTHKNRTAQQEAERRHIGAFLASASIKPEAVEHGDRPDAVLALAGRRIGLEHRELTEEALASNAHNLVALEVRLRDEMKRLGVPGDIQVAVSVDATAPFFRKRRQVEVLATSIAKCAAAKAGEVSVESPARVAAADVAPPSALGADLLVVSRHPRLRDGPYAIVSPAFWGPVDSTLLAAVQEKEKLLPTYQAQQRLDEVWLLLVTGETWVQVTDSVLTEHTRIASQFDRVYVLDLQAGTLQRFDARAAPSST